MSDVDMSSDAVTARLRVACDYHHAEDLSDIAMDASSIEARLRELADVSWLCFRLERFGRALESSPASR